MVIPDLSAPNHEAKQNLKPASTMDRLIAGFFDILLLAPIATFVPALHIREARIDYIQGFESDIWYQIVLLWALTFIIIHTFFLYFTATTPGGMIMHTRVYGLNGKMSWNQCLLRSTFSFFSFLFLGLPFLEVVTHATKRAWHDRVSDTVVADLKDRPFYDVLVFNVKGARFIMIVGIFMVLASLNSVMTSRGEFTFIPDDSSTEQTDSFIAQALLKKDFSEDTQNEIEERIWSSGRRAEKALAYFFKLQVEKNDDVKAALSEQICKWSPSEKSGSLCMLSKYSLTNDSKLLKEMAQNPVEVHSLTSKVFLMKEFTRNSQYSGALKVYQQLKKQASLTTSFKDSLKIWDVSLFWALRENQMRSKRVPASADGGAVKKDESAAAIEEYIKERELK